MRGPRTKKFQGRGGGVRGMNCSEGGVPSFNFPEGDQTPPPTSLNPRTFHIYFFYKSNAVFIK